MLRIVNSAVTAATAIVLVAIGGCANSEAPDAARGSGKPETVAQEREEAVTEEPGNVASDARTWAENAKGTPGTPLEDFMRQIPNDALPPQMGRSGSNRKFTFTFPDGSLIVATFRPRGVEGSGRGLALYTIEIKP